MTTLAIDIWSDIACPWCWVGKRQLEAAVGAFDGEVALTWRAFELDPGASTEAPERVDYAGRLAAKYTTDREGAQRMIGRMVAVGQSLGLELRFDRVRPTNTRAAHRLLAWAAGFGLQTELKERLFAAYLREGLAVSDYDALSELAADVGLDAAAAGAVLERDAHAEEVRRDQDLAHRMGVGGVPFFAIDHRYAVSGAQPAEVLLEAMQRAVASAETATVAGPADPAGAADPTSGEACGPAGCELDRDPEPAGA